uniref:Uncharacterized protein n=1 Tax=Pipistrellus kuhlii TaxID=59472 RepID=A0A7J7VMK5_PIPKU|nr:hypothetical protein mPipKuh1_008380 [Pipistrellus kuhlii]
MGDVTAMCNYRQIEVALVLRPRIQARGFHKQNPSLTAGRYGGASTGRGGPGSDSKAQLPGLLVLGPRRRYLASLTLTLHISKRETDTYLSKLLEAYLMKYRGSVHCTHLKSTRTFNNISFLSLLYLTGSRIDFSMISASGHAHLSAGGQVGGC